MTNRETQKVGLIATGATMFAGVVAHAKMNRKWEEAHTLFSLIAAGITVYGAFA